MTLKDKYKNALALGEKLQIKDGYVTEENGKLKIGGTYAVSIGKRTDYGMQLKKMAEKILRIW
ncbi:MAG: hypothetical protein IPI31_19035 [Bacteroidetes bacterium]|nr:hypothetical protein [Bacteroidota bacterium]